MERSRISGAPLRKSYALHRVREKLLGLGSLRDRNRVVTPTLQPAKICKKLTLFKASG